MLPKLPPTFDEFLRELDKHSAELSARNEANHKKWAEEHPEQAACNHGVTFDKEAALALLNDAEEIRNEKLAMMSPEDAAVDFIMGSPAASEVRARWPRLSGQCPLGCGYNGIYYASHEHYIYGDW